MKLTKEDILKYGTREEIEFLKENFLLETRSLGAWIEKHPEFKDRVMKLFGIDAAGLGKLTYLDDRTFLRQYGQFLRERGIDPTITALIDYIQNPKAVLARF
jgi:hypothetical protein